MPSTSDFNNQIRAMSTQYSFTQNRNIASDTDAAIQEAEIDQTPLLRTYEESVMDDTQLPNYMGLGTADDPATCNMRELLSVWGCYVQNLIPLKVTCSR